MRTPSNAKPKVARAAAVLLTIGVFYTSSFGCADLFETATQCTTDRECEKFDGVCDTAQGVCAPRGSLSNDGGGSGGDTSTTTGNDSATDDVIIPDKCNVSPKPVGTIGTKVDAGRAEITGAVTLGCDKDWTLDALVFVRAGATLTIEAGTTIKAKKGAGAGIVVSTGGKIIANGQRDLPIVLTSDAATPGPGDWRGVFVLGLAPPSGQAPFNDDPDLPWGGANASDSSGAISFTRIEYSESGLTLSGVGNQTKVDFVQVRKSRDNCFFFNGGTADVKHLVCQSSGDDQFEWSTAAQGRAQFLFGQKPAPPPVDGSHGLLIDNSNPRIFNATICGDSPTPLGYGLLFRDGATLDINGAIFSGWFVGLDATGNVPTPGAIRSSIAFGNATNPAYAEDPAETDPDSPLFDDDNGLDELALWNDAASANAETDPKLVKCLDATNPQPWPAAALTTNAPAPPADGFFDANAKYIGAFRDANDGWMKGAWVRFDAK